MHERGKRAASPAIEEAVQGMKASGVSPEEYAARWADGMLCFTLDEYQYRDPSDQAWIVRLGAILRRQPGTPTLEELRLRYLTSEEREAIRQRSNEEF